MLYVVRRPFRTMGKHYPIGTILKDSTGIKLFKTKVREKKIQLLPVEQKKKIELYSYFKHKFGIDLALKVAEGKKVERITIGTEKQVKASEPVGKATVQRAKAVMK